MEENFDNLFKFLCLKCVGKTLNQYSYNDDSFNSKNFKIEPMGYRIGEDLKFRLYFYIFGIRIDTYGFISKDKIDEKSVEEEFKKAFNDITICLKNPEFDPVEGIMSDIEFFKYFELKFGFAGNNKDIMYITTDGDGMDLLEIKNLLVGENYDK